MSDPLNEYIQSGNQAMIDAIDAVNARIKALQEKNQNLLSELANLRSRNAALVEQCIAYGEHLSCCNESPEQPCDCGFEDGLRTVDAIRTTTLDELAQSTILEINQIPTDDREIAHALADERLLKYLDGIGGGGKAVAQAYRDLENRCDGFWYA